MNRVFAELRAAKFTFPRGWDVDRNVDGTQQPSRRHDPAPDVSALPPRTNVQDTGDIAARADRPTQRRYRSDAEIVGFDLFGKPAPAPVYRQNQLPNYAGPAFRSAMSIIDAAFNRPLVLKADTVIVDPPAVLQTPSSTPEVLRRPADYLLLAGRDSDLVRRRWSSARNVALPSEPETGTADGVCSADRTRLAETSPEAEGRRRTLWRRTKRFVRRMFCCGV